VSVIDRLKYWFGQTGTEVYDLENWEIKNIGNLVIPEKLSNKNAFTLANSVAEIYFPVDFYADRISKLRFFIADKNGVEIQTTELNRFINDSINPLFSFSDLVYNYVFSLIADGNAINYLGVPGTYSKPPNVNNISRWDVLQPNLVLLNEISGISMLNVTNWNELIKSVYYNEGGVSRSEINKANVVIHNYNSIRRNDSYVLARSPLWSANKSIDTLLAVYSARYNVYANNGAAGYLAKKSTTGTNQALEAAIMDGNKRDDILADINNRNGLTGKRNIWGISGVPIEFVKTLATIAELAPLEETLENAIKIASVLQIPPVLVPRNDQSTYDNQENAERNVWENGLLSMAQTVCENLTKMFGISKTGNKILFDSSMVSALVQNETDAENLKKLTLENLKAILEINPKAEVTPITDEIINSYGN